MGKQRPILAPLQLWGSELLSLHCKMQAPGACSYSDSLFRLGGIRVLQFYQTKKGSELNTRLCCEPTPSAGKRTNGTATPLGPVLVVTAWQQPEETR